MLSLGSAAFDGNSEIPISTFQVNLELLPNSQIDPDTAEFWFKNKAAYNATRVNPEDPTNAMVRYVTWLKALPHRPVFVGYPAAFDSLFVFWYLWAYAKENPFGWSSLDIKTYAMAHLKIPKFTQSVKRNYPKRYFGSAPHTHVALDDAIEQGILFTRIHREVRGLPCQNNL
jgi:hypothetical protein